MKKNLGVVVIVVGILSGLMFFVAGIRLSSASNEMATIRSVGGTSVAEAYYQGVGEQGLSFSSGLYACGLGIIAISLGFGGLLLSDGEKKIQTERIENTGSSLSITGLEKPKNTRDSSDSLSITG